MKYCFLFFLSTLCACHFTGSPSQTPFAKGNRINISGFSRIISAIPAELRIEMNADSPFHCFLQCEKEIADQIVFDLVNDELHIHTKDNSSLTIHEPVIISMRVQELKSLKNNGSGMVSISGSLTNTPCTIDNLGSGSIQISAVKNEELRVSCLGSGNIKLQGETQAFQCRINGSGSVQAYDLKTEATDAAVNGSGNLEVTALNTLDADIVGSGNIFYHGKPAVRNSITGSGTVAAR